jgi:hypothetical protein
VISSEAVQIKLYLHGVVLNGLVERRHFGLKWMQNPRCVVVDVFDDKRIQSKRNNCSKNQENEERLTHGHPD